MTIIEHRDYKVFLKSWIEAQPKAGRGLLSRIAEHLNLSPGMLSHILNGEKHLSLEAGNDLATFLALNDEETDYLLLLIQYARAGTHSLQERLKLKVLQEQKRSSNLAKKMKPDQELPDSVKAIFYSDWLYSGIRNMIACEQFGNVDQIANHLKVSRSTIQRVADFLVQNGLCVAKKGRLNVGPSVTYTSRQSPLVLKHHQNWRLHGMTKLMDHDDRSIFFTSPMSLSKEAAEMIRLKIPTFIGEVRDLVGPSNSETVYCLNLDWFLY